jgi:hypothetical protein
MRTIFLALVASTTLAACDAGNPVAEPATSMAASSISCVPW